MIDDAAAAQVDVIVWVVTVHHQHHPKCNELKQQQMLDPALQQYFRSLIEGGMSPTQALAVYEESLMGDTQGKLQFNREIKVRPLSSTTKTIMLSFLYILPCPTFSLLYAARPRKHHRIIQKATHTPRGIVSIGLDEDTTVSTLVPDHRHVACI